MLWAIFQIGQTRLYCYLVGWLYIQCHYGRCIEISLEWFISILNFCVPCQRFAFDGFIACFIFFQIICLVQIVKFCGSYFTTATQTFERWQFVTEKSPFYESCHLFSLVVHAGDRQVWNIPAGEESWNWLLIVRRSGPVQVLSMPVLFHHLVHPHHLPQSARQLLVVPGWTVLPPHYLKIVGWSDK